ncbi:uncharacterized protein involved in exopolysaccharide biosynthesis [Microbacterium ginsengiterrae]|uniref:Uncharacterized protein involved in exopolysaccharide biosynthesis n=1 Tax=Microbacterium ginsengiterrae TaxID=546115 RepID=A0A7W9FBP7_9MICO|nr:hypothetical protein [Microbacterium ginsengiterrae]MBB5743380.1 uncharacterized protein involved in exopolysaccharide biosynthesis [Microbacterium ginsengiterrae]
MLARQWLVLVVGTALTVAGAVAAVQMTGVFTARTTITLLPPPGWAIGGNTLTDSAATMVGFAKLIEQTVNDSQDGQLFAAPDTPLYGAGVRQGELVYVPNAGGQWAPNFNRPFLYIDVVGPTPEYVESRVEALTEEVADAVDERQDEFGVAEDQRVTWDATPATPEVSYVGPNRLRMLGGIALLGAGVTAGAAFGVDLLRKRRADARATVH